MKILPARGFTLIELLVVIAIIGLMAGITMASMTYVRQRGRDTNRYQSVKALKDALEIYATEHARFPAPGQTTPATLTGSDVVSTELLSSGAIRAIPQDPQSPLYDFKYSTDNIGSTYTITFCLETNSISGYMAGCTNTLQP